MAILRLIRLPNLLIVILTQYLLQYLVISPAFKTAGVEKTLDNFHFFLLVFITVIITISGYIINDILDYDLDLINKPEKVIVNKIIAAETVYRIYHIINFLGLILSLYLAIYIQNIPLVGIYPAAIAWLYLYSKLLKKKTFWGNLTVAIFCAFVAGIVLFAEREGFLQLPPGEFQRVKIIFGAFIIFAFLSTLYREIIKDIEDFKGDQSKGCETLPIKYGIPLAKFIALATGIVLMLFTIWWMMLQMTFFHSIQLLFVVILFIFLPIFVSLILLKMADLKKDYSKLSKVAKYIMVSGILYLLFLI